MKKVLAYCSALILSLMLAGCGEATLDTSTEEALKASVQEMNKPLSAEKKEAFKQALAGTYMMIGMKAVFQGKDKEQVQVEIREALDGKTVEETISLFKELKAAKKQG